MHRLFTSNKCFSHDYDKNHAESLSHARALISSVAAALGNNHQAAENMMQKFNLTDMNAFDAVKVSMRLGAIIYINFRNLTLLL